MAYRPATATDAKIDMDAIPDRTGAGPEPDEPGYFLLILGVAQEWSMVEHARAFMGMVPCPVCGLMGPERPDPGRYCLGCDRGVGGAPRTAPAPRKGYRRGKLKGGVGR